MGLLPDVPERQQYTTHPFQQPETALLHRESQIELSTLIGSLPEKQQQAMLLFYVRDWSEADIAKELCCSLNTVKSYLRRGRISLYNQGFTPLAVCYASRTGKAWGLPLERLYQESGERMHKQEQHTADTEHGRGGTLHHLSLAKGYVCSRVAWLDDCMICQLGSNCKRRSSRTENVSLPVLDKSY